MTPTSTRFRGRVLILTLILASIGRGALADEGAMATQAHAAQVFAEAERAFKSADYERAAKLFEEAHQLRPHPASLANAAKARRLMGDLAASANHYQELASTSQASDDVKEAKAALAALAPMLGRLTIVESRANHRVALDGAPLARAQLGPGRSVYVTPGTHQIESVDGEGRVTRRAARILDGEASTIELEEAATRAVTSSPPQSAPRSMTTPADHSSFQVSPLVTAIAAGVVLIGAGVTTWSGVDTLNERSAWDAHPSNATLDSGLDKQRRTNLLLGVTLGTAAVTGVLAIFFTRWHEGSGAR